MPQKIDDFDASSQGQQAGPCCADEAMPEWAGEIARRELAPKGQFYGAHEFCNCLINHWRNMGYKRIAGAVTSLAGIALIIYAVHSMSVISDAKSQVKNMSNQMSGNYVGKMMGTEMQARASAYDKPVQIGLYTGVALVIVGAGLIFLGKKKKK